MSRFITPYAAWAPGWLSRTPPSLPLLMRHWLFRPGALTAALRQLGEVELHVVAEYVAGVSRDEATVLSLTPRSPIWVREVRMSINGLESLCARSITPLKASHGIWQGMRRLRTRPLADMLYHDRSVARSPFVCRRVTGPAPHDSAVLHATHPSTIRAGLWARRSVFWRQQHPLLVTEYFLPVFWPLAAGYPVPPLLPHLRTLR